MRRLRSHRGAEGRGSQDCGTRGVIAIVFPPCALAITVAKALAESDSTTHERSCYPLTNVRRAAMAKGEQKGNRESKKPKKEKVKTIAAASSQKGVAAGWQPTFGSGKKK